MNAPLLLFSLTSGFAAVAVALRGRPNGAAAVASVGSGLLAVFALGAPLDTAVHVLGIPSRLPSAWIVLGRSFALAEATRAGIGLLFAVGALLFSVAGIARSPTYLFPLGLLLLAIVGGSMMIQPFVFAPILLAFGAMASVLLLATYGYPARQGALRLLSLYLLAMAITLTAGWLLDVRGVTAGAPDLAQRVTVLLGLGLAILMGIPPFHIWLPTAAEQAHPSSLTFVAVVLQSAGLFFLLQFLNAYEWLRVDAALFEAIRWAGAGVVLFGTAWAMAQRSFRRMAAYALVADLGIMLIAVGVGSGTSYQLALGLSGARVISLGVWALGAALLSRAVEEGGGTRIIDGARRHPEAALAALVGVLSLGGLPLTAGFPGRWALLAAVAGEPWLLGAVVLVGIGGIGLASLRWIISAFESSTESAPSRGLGERIAALSGAAICILLGVFPQITYPWVVQTVSGLRNLVP